MTRSYRPEAGFVLLVALAAPLVFAFAAAPAGATIYRYVDDQGVTHFSDGYDAVPDRYREQVREISNELRERSGYQVLGGPGGEPQGREAHPADAGNPFFAFEAGSGDAARAFVTSLGPWFFLLALLAAAVFVVLGGLVLKLACRIAGADPPTLGRACLILFAQSLVGSVAGGLVNVVALHQSGEEMTVLGGVAVAAASGLLSWVAGAAVFNGMTSCGFPRALFVGAVHTALVLVLVLGPIAGIASVFWLLS